MEISEINNFLPQKADKELLLATVKQLQKDLAEFSLEVELNLSSDFPYQEVHEKLIPFLTYIIEKRQDIFASILYRIDIQEDAVKRAVSNQEDSNIAERLSRLIIERELKKVLFRNHFSKR